MNQHLTNEERMNIQLATIRTYAMMAKATRQNHYLVTARELLEAYKLDKTITVIYKEAA